MDRLLCGTLWYFVSVFYIIVIVLSDLFTHRLFGIESGLSPLYGFDAKNHGLNCNGLQDYRWRESRGIAKALSGVSSIENILLSSLIITAKSIGDCFVTSAVNGVVYFMWKDSGAIWWAKNLSLWSLHIFVVAVTVKNVFSNSP